MRGSKWRSRLALAALGGAVCLPAQASFAMVISANPATVGKDLILGYVPSTGQINNISVTTGAQTWYDFGLFGQNSIIANVEGGHVWNGHETLAGVSNYVTGTGALGDFDYHATAVGMIMAGLPPADAFYSQLGIAPLANLRSGAIATAFDTATGSFDTTDASVFSTYAAEFGVADVINSSWGSDERASGFNHLTVSLDGMARAHPNTTFVVAAGNGGPGPNTISSPANGYNNISVGALTTDAKFNYTVAAPFSSRGPQDYEDSVHGLVPGVRAAIDMVAPGNHIFAAAYGGSSGGNTGGALFTPFPDTNLYFTDLAGTSFAAPIVAGGVGLLDGVSHQFLPFSPESRDARVIKAVLLNSADKLPGWNNGQHLVGSVLTTTQSLDYTLGAGALNLDHALYQYLPAFFGPGNIDVAGTAGGTIRLEGWDYATVSPLVHNDYVFSDLLFAGGDLTVTLDWFRNDSFVSNDLSSDNGFANLNLQVWDSTFTTLIAQSISDYNEVEHLSFVLNTTGRYGLRVLHAGNVFGTATPETYGLAWNVSYMPEPMALLFPLAGIALLRRRRA